MTGSHRAAPAPAPHPRAETPRAGRTQGPHRLLALAVAIATLVAGPVALRLAFAAGEGSASLGASTVFAASSLLLAAIWTAGGLTVIALHGADAAVRTVGRPQAAGAGAIAGVIFAIACLVGALVLRSIPATRDWVAGALQTARAAPAAVVLGVDLLAGAGEEVFFRLALPRLLTGRLRWLVPIALYAAATVATGNVGLVIVAVPLGGQLHGRVGAHRALVRAAHRARPVVRGDGGGPPAAHRLTPSSPAALSTAA